MQWVLSLCVRLHQLSLTRKSEVEYLQYPGENGVAKQGACILDADE